jgi:hypothetical protein
MSSLSGQELSLLREGPIGARSSPVLMGGCLAPHCHCHLSITAFSLSPQLFASHLARIGAPAAGPSSVSAALASAGPAVRRSFLRRSLTPRTPGQHPDAQWMRHPTYTGTAPPEKEHSHWPHSCHQQGKSPPQQDPRVQGSVSLQMGFS